MMLRDAQPSETPTEYRYELKFEIFACDAGDLTWLVRTLPAGFRVAYPTRYVNNIYLDTPTFSDYRLNVMGSANRSKLRVRWYGDVADASTGSVLENKRRRGLVGTKLQHRLSSWNMDRGSMAESLAPALCDLPDALAPLAATRRPVLVNRYRRRYFAASGRDVRLTVDDDLSFGRLDALHRPLISAVHPRAIIELKFPVALQAYGFRCAAALPFRLSRFSKYVEGVRFVYASGSAAGFSCSE